MTIFETFDNTLVKSCDKKGNPFKILYFKTFSLCLKNLNEFLHHFEFIDLSNKEDLNLADFTILNISNDKSCTLGVSCLLKYLRKRFETDFEELKNSNQEVLQEIYITLTEFFNECAAYFANEVLFDEIILSIENNCSVIEFMSLLYIKIKHQINTIKNN